MLALESSNLRWLQSTKDGLWIVELKWFVNSDQFQWKNILENYFETVQINMGFVDVETHLVDSIINRDLAEEFSRDKDVAVVYFYAR